MPGGRRDCGRCSYCVYGEVPLEPRGAIVPVNEHKVMAILKQFPEFSDNPRVLVRVALGIGHVGSRDLVNNTKEEMSMARRMSRENPLFSCMRNCDFWVS